MALNSPQEVWRILRTDFRKNPALQVLIAIISLLGLWTTFLSLEPWLRWSGMTLQLCGFYLVYVSIDKRRQSFNGRQIRKSVQNWLIHIFVRPPPITASLQATGIAAITSVGRARLTHRPTPDASLEERLAIIEQARFDNEREVDSIWQKISKVESDLTTSINRESVSWRAQTSASEERFADAIAGDVHIDLFGVWLFVVGVVIASASVEIECFFDSLIAFLPI